MEVTSVSGGGQGSPGWALTHPSACPAGVSLGRAARQRASRKQPSLTPFIVSVDGSVIGVVMNCRYVVAEKSAPLTVMWDGYDLKGKSCTDNVDNKSLRLVIGYLSLNIF